MRRAARATRRQKVLVENSDIRMLACTRDNSGRTVQSRGWHAQETTVVVLFSAAYTQLPCRVVGGSGFCGMVGLRWKNPLVREGRHFSYSGAKERKNRAKAFFKLRGISELLVFAQVQVREASLVSNENCVFADLDVERRGRRFYFLFWCSDVGCEVFTVIDSVLMIEGDVVAVLCDVLNVVIVDRGIVFSGKEIPCKMKLLSGGESKEVHPCRCKSLGLINARVLWPYVLTPVFWFYGCFLKTCDDRVIFTREQMTLQEVEIAGLIGDRLVDRRSPG
ncbi:hypothetical protein VNO80_10226 [Phaseolus coccineus]|uniref:Uncharacterized protein n=1 Tax=Phaseolus coccineus TaxID=3886 RepID=A0AAN9QHE0_PHACN